ncbi:acyltransferase [Cohnella silvisoli]|uniref:Acyltransferase n=1 Tax=Cohnella silvisoli TaxID=2873699 RepID=A0ABV1KPT3_9BACL|nr:acyltransferase [Cohnella silvisoli]MCD9022300.1 acyltransferase [Cohnella silvisoli]
MERRAKLLELDLFRAICILSVILIHATSFATVKMTENNLYGVYNFLNIFSKFGVTSFIFLSGFVFFYNYYPQPLTAAKFKTFYRNRLLYILVPYFLFSAFYFLLRWYQNKKPWDLSDLLPSFGGDLLTGQAYTHLYFIFITIQFYLLFPIVLLLFQRFKWLAASAVILGIVVQWAFFLLNREYWQVPIRGSWSLTYFGHYFLGAWLGIHYDRIKSWLIIAKENITRSKIILWIIMWGLCLSSGFIYVSMFYRAKIYGTRFTNLQYDGLWDIFTLLFPFLLLQVCFLLGKRIQTTWWVGRLNHLGVVSFGVFLIHPLVLLVYRKFPVNGGSPWIHHLWYAGGFFCALFISWIIVTVMSRMSWSWLLFGNVSSQLKGPTQPQRTVEAPPSTPSSSA